MEVSDAAERDLKRLPQQTARRIISHLRSLEVDPRPLGVKRLKGGLKGMYRLRIGDYRVIYAVDDVVRIVEVAAIGHRSRIYD